MVSVNYMDDVGFDLYVPEDIVIPAKSTSTKNSFRYKMYWY